MQLTLLEMTQTILGEMDGDEVNSISDTAEASQIAKVIRSAYFNIFSRANLPEQNKMFSLTASGDLALPVLMTRPSNVGRIDWIKYNTSEDASTDPTFDYVTIIPQVQFVDMMHALDLTETFVDQLTLDTHEFFYYNDRMPKFCTILNDNYVVFDAFDNTEETTLQSNKTLCGGLVIPIFTMADSYVPAIDENQFPLLMNEAKSLAFYTMKQMPHEKAEKEARRQWISLQKNKKLTDVPTAFDELPSFGRR